MITPKTICRDCVFAEFKGNRQVDCNFYDRLWQLETNGGTLLLKNDGVKEYYEIDGRFCSACRNQAWGKENPRKDWFKLIENRIALRMDYVILTDSETTLGEILQTFEQAESQNPKPTQIMVILNPEDLPKFDLLDLTDNVRDKSIVWRIEHNSVEKAMKYIKGIHYTVWFAGSDIPMNFSERINQALNYEMVRFIGLRPNKDGNGLVFQTGVPIDEAIQKDGIQDYIKVWEDL